MVTKNDHLQKEADEPKPPHFFKIIIQDSTDHGNFVFPKSFIRTHGEKLQSNVVRLRVPTGDVWEMELQRCNGGVWLEKNRWRSFASFYSLGFGHLLVFRFVEIGGIGILPEFEVIICDKSTSEIKYPKLRCSVKAEPSDGGCMQDREPVTRSRKKQLRDRESLDSQMNPRKKMKMSKDSSPKLEKAKKGKKKKAEASCMQNRERVIRSLKKRLRDHESPNLQLNFLKKKKISKALSSRRIEKVQKGLERDHDKTNGFHGKVQQRNAEVKVTRENVEKEVIGKKKSHFVKFTMPAYTRSYCVLPVWFAEEIHQVCKVDEVLIKDPMGREWVVKMKYRASPNPRYDLTTGWKEFRNANKLAVGDTLEFNHIKGRSISVKVLPKCNSSNKHLRDHDSPNSQLNKISKSLSSLRLEKVQNGEERDHDKKKSAGKMHSLNSIEKAEALLRAESFRSANPYFKMVMQPSYINLRYILIVPARFMQTYMPRKTGQVKLVCASNGKTWTASYRVFKAESSSYLQARIHQGWETFAKENQLVVGDVCVFELIKKVAEGEVSFKVTIFRAPQASKPNVVDEEFVVTSKKSVPTHPFFEIVIPSSWTTLTVPASFAKMHFDLETMEQMIKLEAGYRSWAVKLLNYKYRATSVMSAGMRAFVKENSINVGDLCTFELIDSNQMLFKVSFTRNSTVKLDRSS